MQSLLSKNILVFPTHYLLGGAGVVFLIVGIVVLSRIKKTDSEKVKSDKKIAGIVFVLSAVISWLLVLYLSRNQIKAFVPDSFLTGGNLMGGFVIPN